MSTDLRYHLWENCRECGAELAKGAQRLTGFCSGACDDAYAEEPTPEPITTCENCRASVLNEVGVAEWREHFRRFPRCQTAYYELR